MKKNLLLTLTLFLTFVLNAQNVNIPDVYFKTILTSNISINTNSDSEIQISEAIAFTGALDCSFGSILDLTGIEAFTNLVGLDCSHNGLTTLDVSLNTKLETLYCHSNSLTSLDLSQNVFLDDLTCQANSITSLDLSNNPEMLYLECQENSLSTLNLSGCSVLDYIDCSENNLTSLDASSCVILDELECQTNMLTSLDLSSNVALTYIDCSDNNLTSLDLTSNTALITIDCFENNLTSLDVTSITVLEGIFCHENAIKFLDFSQNTALTQMECDNNELLAINLANGNNTAISDFDFFVYSNPNLTCIQVDDAAWSTANWTSIDAGASFSDDCNYLVNSITVDGQGGISVINTPTGTLQMEAAVLPSFAGDNTYTWSVANGTGAATISASGLLTASTAGTVTVTATANDASGATGTKNINITDAAVSINDLSFDALKIFPNPSKDFINIVVAETLSSIKITDFSGKIVKTFSPESKQLNISELSKGLYFLEIANAEKRSIIKIMKK